ncbi:MAG: hypothetical protein R2850_13680 [Bacteroidia bacterium]
MKARITLLLIIFSSCFAAAQDVITKMNGEEIKAKILEISPSEIKYKRFDYQQGPTIILPTSDVFMVKYPNGEKQMFQERNQASGTIAEKPVSYNVPEGFIAYPAGSKIQLELQETISSSTIHEGQTVNFKVKTDIVQNGLLLIRAGEAVIGQVVKAEKARELGREGQLHIKVTQVMASNGQVIPLSGNIYKDGENRSTESIGIAALIFWPALFLKGKEAEIPSGSIFVSEVAETIFFKAE